MHPLAPFGPVWPMRLRLGPFWTHLALFDPTLSRLTPLGPAWPRLAQIGLLGPAWPLSNFSFKVL